MADPVRFETPEMLELASSAIGKVDAFGPRGATLVSMDEIEAMAAALVAFGLVATPPGAKPPAVMVMPARPTMRVDDRNFDPNFTMCGNRARQVIRLTFGLWEYRLTVMREIQGNLTGLESIEWAIAGYYADLCKLLPNKGFGDVPTITMTSLAGDTLECSQDDDERDGEEWLSDMLIAADVVSIEALPKQQKKDR